ncbi:hypothetical protein, conserved [Angomonas deanei]|uniref:Uncharacterized protein n=1 Tax=Angomonas deanei TaxID=59799 RepID=A0A7G2CM29_9TRYP|nr:hypothetical protein, conserved [Angomonas deanei]
MIEEVLSSDFIAYVLSALSRHSLYAEVAVASTHFFSELADLQSPQGDFSLATLFCHVGTVLPSLLDTLRHHPHHLVIQENVFQFICMAARHRENIVPLFNHGAYPLIANALLDQLHKPLLFQTSCEAIGYFIAALDQFQRRSLILLLKKILVGRAELEVQLYCVALLCSLSAHFGEGKGSPAVGPYAAYSLYAQPTSVVEETPKEEVRQKTNSPRAVVLKESDTIDFERDDDSRRFVKEACVPQVLMNLMEYYTRAIHALEIDESEEKLVQSLCGVASKCLALMMS